jgi:hypothetical protein
MDAPTDPSGSSGVVISDKYLRKVLCALFNVRNAGGTG